MPFLTALLGLGIAAAGAGVGGYEQNKSANAQQQGLSDQNSIAQQELAGKQQAFNQEESFYSPYLKSGSPFLANMQTASAQQNQNQFGQAAGQLRNTMQTNGLGYGPSGSTAAALGGMAGQSAATGAGDYLQNLLNNEQVKFQAAQGINSAGQMIGSSQNQPNVSAQLPQASLAGSIGASGNTLAGAINNASNNNTANNAGTLPLGTTGTALSSGLGLPGVGGTGAPATGGYGGDEGF
jgi:hypothetical protein